MAGVTTLDAQMFEAKALAAKALEKFASTIRFVARGGHRIAIIGF